MHGRIPGRKAGWGVVVDAGSEFAHDVEQRLWPEQVTVLDRVLARQAVEDAPKRCADVLGLPTARLVIVFWIVTLAR